MTAQRKGRHAGSNGGSKPLDVPHRLAIRFQLAKMRFTTLGRVLGAVVTCMCLLAA